MPPEVAANPAVYDVSTREGYLRRATETTDRRIPPRYRSAMASHPDVVSWCESYGLGASSLLILGVTGAGKTYEAYGAIRSLAAKGSLAEWASITAPDLYARLRPHEGTDAETEFRRYADVPLLLLDDLGAAKNSEFTEEITYRLIGHRYDLMTPCLVTSNVPTAQLGNLLGARVASRLREMCKFVTMSGPDRRKASQ
jgi:DNA replication protein DnaC